MGEETNPDSFGGVSILTVTPLDRDGRLCDEDFVSLLRFVSGPSVDGTSIRSVTVCGEMGEGFCLLTDDRSRVIRIAKDFLGKGKSVIAAIFALSVRRGSTAAAEPRRTALQDFPGVTGLGDCEGGAPAHGSESRAGQPPRASVRTAVRVRSGEGSRAVLMLVGSSTLVQH